MSVNIQTPNYKVLINEADGEFIVIHGGQETAEPYKPLFQSQLTNLIVEEIIESGESSLTSFSESKGIHLPFIRTIKAHLEKSLNENLEACPIT